jgi:PAS domain S-box-containing protein
VNPLDERLPSQCEAFGRALVEAVSDCVFVVDPDGRLEMANPSGRTLLAVRDEQAVAGRPLTDFLPFVGPERLRDLIARAEHGEVVRVTWDWRRPERQDLPLEAMLRGLPEQRTLIVVRSPEAASQAEIELRESERRLRLAQRVGRLGAFEWLVADDRIIWSPELIELYRLPDGTAPTNVRGWLLLLEPSDAERVREGLEACIAARCAEHAYEFRVVMPDGTHRWTAGQARFSYDQQGRPLRMIGINVDINDRKRNEMRSEFMAQLAVAVRPLVEPRDIADTTVRLLGEFLRVHRCAYAAVEGDEDTFTILGNYARGLPPLEGKYQLSAFGEEALRLQRSGRPHVVSDTEAIRLEDAPRELFRRTGIRAVVAVPLNKQGRLVAGIAVHHRFPHPWSVEDVELVELAANACWESMERARVAAELRASERRLRLALTSARMVAWEVDPETGKAEVLDNAAEVFGLGRDQGLPDTEAGFALMHPEDEAAHRELFARTMRECGSYQTQFRVLRPDGNGVTWVEERAYAVCGKDGRPQRFVGIMIDITERKRAEQELREAHTLLADKAAHLETLVQQRTAKLKETIGELESFSYSIAHDLRGPLRSLEGFSRILLEDYAAALPEPGQELLRRIARSAERMDRLTRDVLNYSRIGQEAIGGEPIDVGALVRDLVQTYPQLGVEVADIVVESPLPRALASSALLTQVLSNLLGNAVKFVPPGVRPRVEIRGERRGERVRIAIADNGIGVPPEQRTRIFGMFEKLNPSYEGTGIGLAIVKKAMDRMGGSITLEPRPGGGSVFSIELPAA